jgi:hypothetical protein
LEDKTVGFKMLAVVKTLKDLSQLLHYNVQAVNITENLCDPEEPMQAEFRQGSMRKYFSLKATVI